LGRLAPPSDTGTEIELEFRVALLAAAEQMNRADVSELVIQA
jgi:hypothetical protein